MRKTNKTPVFLLFCYCLLSACSTEPKAIAYNVDQCAECKMMISDQRFGAELVTKKGKVSKYDAAECMINAFNKSEDLAYAHILVTDFTQPAQLIDARTSIYLVSKERPSPMGAFLSAYVSKSNIENYHGTEDDQIFNWDQIKENFK